MQHQMNKQLEIQEKLQTRRTGHQYTLHIINEGLDAPRQYMNVAMMLEEKCKSYQMMERPLTSFLFWVSIV